MIDRIVGRVVDKTIDYAVVMTGGIGYALHMPSRAISRLERDKEIEIYTHLHVREDALMLYGFTEEEDRRMFHLLIGVTGIGPKVALGVLGDYTAEELVGLIQANDIKGLTKAPGIGKKTAERLLLELKDKVRHVEVAKVLSEEVSAEKDATREALEALIGLGYSETEAKRAVEGIEEENTAEAILKSALRRLSGHR